MNKKFFRIIYTGIASIMILCAVAYNHQAGIKTKGGDLTPPNDNIAKSVSPTVSPAIITVSPSASPSTIKTTPQVSAKFEKALPSVTSISASIIPQSIPNVSNNNVAKLNMITNRNIIAGRKAFIKRIKDMVNSMQNVNSCSVVVKDDNVMVGVKTLIGKNNIASVASLNKNIELAIKNIPPAKDVAVTSNGELVSRIYCMQNRMINGNTPPELLHEYDVIRNMIK